MYYTDQELGLQITPSNNTNFCSVSQRSRLTPGRRCVLPDAARRTTTHAADRHGVGGRPRRLAWI